MREDRLWRYPESRFASYAGATRNGEDDNPARIALGDTKAHPDSATFSAVRAV